MTKLQTACRCLSHLLPGIALLSGGALANDSHWYAGASLGQARGKVDASEMDRRMAELGYDSQATVSGQDRTAWGAFGGYQWNRYLAFEAGYTDLGEVNTELSGVESDIDDYLDSANVVHPRTADGIELAVLGQYPLSSRLQVFGRAGYLLGESRYQADAGLDEASRSDSDTLFTWGLGLDYRFQPNWSVRGGWSQYRVEGEQIDVLGISLLYRFTSDPLQ